MTRKINPEKTKGEPKFLGLTRTQQWLYLFAFLAAGGALLFQQAITGPIPPALPTTAALPSPVAVVQAVTDVPTLVAPTATITETAAPTATITETAAPTASSIPPTAAPLVMPTSTWLVNETTEYGEVLTFNPVQTYYAGSNGAKLRTCPNRSCEAAASLLAGEKFIANGAIDGEEVETGNKLWFRTQIGEQVLYGYSGIMGTQSSSSTVNQSISQPTIVSGGSCPNISATCGELGSCDAARACLAAGNGKLDQDKDGIPCESICGN